MNEAANFLEAHPATVRKWIRDGKIPAHRIGRLGNYFLYEDELQQVVDAETRTQLDRK